MRHLLLALGFGLAAFTSCYAQFQFPSNKRAVASPRSREAPTYWAGFDALPDTTAACSVALYVQTPAHGSPGAVFLGLRKTSGRDSVVSYLGFARLNPYQGLFSNQPVPAKLTSEAYHAYDASWTRPLTAAELKRVCQEIQRLTRSVGFQTRNFNGVDFALQVVNQITGIHPLLLTERRRTPKRLLKTMPADPAATTLIMYKQVYTGSDHLPSLTAKNLGYAN